MATKKEPTTEEDWMDMEKEYWRNIASSREKDDAARNKEYAMHQDELRRRLVDCYDKKARLEQDLQNVIVSIEHYEERQERVAQDFEDESIRMAKKRREEDHAQQEWFVRSRDNAVSKENARPKSSSSSRRQSNRDTATSQANGVGWTSINGSKRRSRREEDEEPPADPGNLLSSIYHNPVDESDSINGRAMPLRSGNRARPGPGPNGVGSEMDPNTTEGYAASRTKDRLLKPKQRHSLPSFPSSGRSLNGKTPGSDSGTSKTKSPPSRKSLPSAKGSVPLTENPTLPISAGQEITRDKLVFKDDGHVITEPAMYAGIPLERIDHNHPYWDPEWEPLEAIIQPQLDKWKEKLDQLRRSNESPRHTIFLANRQVNRGQSVIDFIKDESWHPYQFVGKDMMGKFYKTLVNYDTMFRLVNVHEELKKFDLEVTSLEWLRQRMYDIAEAQGDKFNLSKTMHDLYHDASLKYLREKHGFGNIGRPSGYKLNKDPEKAAAKKFKQEAKQEANQEIKQESGSIRRKARRSIGQVDPDDTPSIDDMQRGLEQPQSEPLEPVTPRLQKRQRIEPVLTVEEPEDDDLEHSGWTSTDSFSAGRIMHLDWRVYQIKTRALTTSPEVTQYWTWKQEKNLFEHQVLRDVHPKVTWGFYQKPINFDLSLEEIIEIKYAPDSQKIIVYITDEKRGNTLAYFKRERTKKRFLSFAKKKGIKLAKSTRLQVEKLWETMESLTLPDEDSET